MVAVVVVFTGDLRLHDNPVLHAALESGRRESGRREVVPLFVRDPAIADGPFGAPNRLALLADCLADLDAGLRERGGRLVVRSGAFTEQVCRVAAEARAEEVHIAAGASGYAARRERLLREALAAERRRLVVHSGVTTAVPPGLITPGGASTSAPAGAVAGAGGAAGDRAAHFAVFTPYHRHWSRKTLRRPLGAPRKVRVPERIASEELPDRAALAGVSPGLGRGGERAARERLSSWLSHGLAGYGDPDAAELAGASASRLSTFLHFGALSATETVHRVRAAADSDPALGPAAEAFARQLCRRDFHHQVLAARPDAAHADYRPRGDAWRAGRAAEADAAAWREGRTGYPVVDAAMRQLREEGWIPDRARMLCASFLTKTLYLDWRIGARHFLDLLADGDLANNQLNWQWVAGTGTDTRSNRVLNPVLQARRHDPDGAYVRRWVPELAAVPGRAVHEPWRLADDARPADYPAPVVDLAEGLARFRAARAAAGAGAGARAAGAA